MYQLQVTESAEADARGHIEGVSMDADLQMIVESIGDTISSRFDNPRFIFEGIFLKTVHKWEADNHNNFHTMLSNLPEKDRKREIAKLVLLFEEEMLKLLESFEDYVRFKSTLIDVFTTMERHYSNQESTSDVPDHPISETKTSLDSRHSTEFNPPGTSETNFTANNRGNKRLFLSDKKSSESDDED